MESVGVRVRARRLRHMAGAAQHASPTLSTLSERSAQSDTLKNARPSPQATRRCGVIAHRSIRRSRIHKSCVRLLTCVAAGAACLSGCRTCALTLHGAGAPAAARAWPPHPIRVVDMGETARTSCDRRSCLWQPLTRSCLRQPCVRRRRHESAPHGWCCSARIADALHAERTRCSIAHAAERVRAARRAPPRPCAHRQRHVRAAGRCGERVGGRVGRSGWACDHTIFGSEVQHTGAALGPCCAARS